MRMVPRYNVSFSLKDAIIAIKYLFGKGRIMNTEVRWLKKEGYRVIFTWSGRVALRLILRAIKLEPGEPVVVPLWTCSQVHRAILAEGGRLHFVNVSEDSLMPSVEDYVRAVRESGSRIVVVISYWGYPVDLAPFRRVLPREVIMIKDCALSWGSSLRGVQDGFDADFAFFSFGVGKPLCLGGGGALIFDSRKFQHVNSQELIHQLSPPPLSALYEVLLHALIKGIVFGLPPIYGLLRTILIADHEGIRLSTNGADGMPMWQAPPWVAQLGEVKSKHTLSEIAHRRRKWLILREVYRELGIQTLEEKPEIVWNHWMPPILLPGHICADEFAAWLTAQGFEAKRPYKEAASWISTEDTGAGSVPNWILGPALDSLSEDDLVSFVNTLHILVHRKQAKQESRKG